jgi:hypothetical protein
VGTLVVSDALGYSSTSTALSYTLPASPAILAGDVIVIAVYHGNAATHSGVTAGYTAGATGTNGTACKGTVYTDTAAGGEEGSTFALTLSSGSSKVVALQVWRGVTLDSVNGNQTGASANVVSPAVTATAQPGVALAIGGGRGAGDGTQPGVTTWPSGYTSGPSGSSLLTGTNRNTGVFISSLAITSTTVASATTVATQSLSYVGLRVVLTDSGAGTVNADATVTDTHGTSATVSATSPINATATDTHGTSATVSATSPINATHTDTHGISATASASSPGVENANATVVDTHGTSATISATSPIGATIVDTHGISASATASLTVNASASVVTTHSISATATATSPFPFGPTAVRVALDLDGSGAFATDITPWVALDDGVQIERGRQQIGSSADNATMKLRLNNADHRFSMRNVDGPYFGLLVRNTAIRADLPLLSDHYLDAPIGVALPLATPDSAGLSITGDLDVRVDLSFPTWRPGGTGMTVLSKWNTTGNQRSWTITLDGVGKPVLFWSNDGTTVLSAGATVPVSYTATRQAIRATLDVNNGSAGNTVTFYTAATLAGTWTQLGDPVITAGTTSVFDSTSPVAVGDTTTGGGRAAIKVYGAAVLQGIGGTLRANLSLALAADGAASVTDAIGNVWTVATGARLNGRDIRYTGRVPSWPEGHGRIDDDSSVPVTAYDVFRRIGRARAPLSSAYKRGCLSTVAPVTGLLAYWPMEDPAGSTQAAAGRSGDRAMQMFGRPDWAADSGSFACSQPLPKMGTAYFTGTIATYTATNQIQVRVLLSVPAAGTTNGAVLLRLTCGGTAARWEVVYGTGGALTLNAYDSTGASLLSTSAAFAVNGVPVRLNLGVAQNGSGVDWTLSTLVPGTTSGGLLNGTLASNTVTLARQVAVATTGNLGDAVMGHLTVQSAVTGFYDLDDQLMAYRGEDAAGRIARLCAEEGIPAPAIGGGGPKLGPQLPVKLLDLLRECETSDAGLLFTPRATHGIAYRPLRTLTNRDPVLSMAYNAGAIDTLAPIPDDQATVNDVTASRASGGSSARYTLTSGPLSVLDPPDGVGLYDGSLTVSALGDDVLEDHASWAVHIGTVDEDRVPAVGFNLAARYFNGDVTPTAIAAAIAALDVGDRILVTSVPTSWGGLDDVDQIVIGLQEEIGIWEHRIVAVCAPARPYRTLRWGVGDRWTSAGSTVNGAHTLGDTTLSVSTPGGSLWGHGSGDFDVRIAGRTMTVTGVSGASSPQVFTIAGGIPAALVGGEIIELAQRRFWAM